jgi:hypothetical protein
VISKKVFFFGIILLLLLIWVVNCSPEADVAPGNDRFGLCFISDPDHRIDEARYRGALETGARWDRWPLYWHWVDEGGYVGSHPGGTHDYDTLVTQDIAHGLTPVVILLGTPARHTKSVRDVGRANSANANTPTLPPASLMESIFTDGSDTPGPGKTINPANAWAHFVFSTVERYRPRGILARQQGWPRGVGVRYWEVWNEPDFRSFWSGSVEEYYRLLEVAYQSIKTADPGATVILGGLAFYDQRAWFPELLRQTGGQPDRAYFDVFSFHHYLSIYRSEWLIRQARAALDAQGLTDIPLWITESGVSVWDDYPATAHGVSPDTPYRGTMVEQAAYVIQNSALAFYNGVERYYHFMLHDDCGDGPASAYGLRQNFSPNAYNPADGKPRPAYAAYQLAAEQFRDLSPLWRSKQPEQDRVAFYRPADRSRLVVLWATRGLTVTTTLTATGDVARLYWIEPTESPAGTTGLSRTLTLTPTNGLYNLTLLPATNQNDGQVDDSSYQIGGPPVMVVERDIRPPYTQIQPLPSTSPLSFVLQWQPEELGSGIAGYDVYVSEGDGPFELWLENTLQTEVKFTGQVNQTYRFAVRARDQAGNEEPLVAHPLARTRTVFGSPIAGVVLGPRAEPVPNASVTLTGPNVQESAVTGEDGRWPPIPLLPGDYTLQADAPGYAAWPAPRRVTSGDETTTITTTVAPVANAIASGDFEDDQVWQEWQWEGRVNLSIDAFDGQAAARLGEGSGEPVVCPDGRPGQLWMLRQTVSIPPETEPVLSFLYKISAAQSATNDAWWEVLLLIDGQPYYLVTPHELGPTPDWRFAFQDLSAWSGETADLEFGVHRCSDQPFAVSLDRISIGH